MIRFTQIATTSPDDVWAIDENGQLWRYHYGPLYKGADDMWKADRIWECVTMPEVAHA